MQIPSAPSFHDIDKHFGAVEAQSAADLAQKFSRHAFTISHMARLMHQRAWSISEFIEIYNEQPEKVRGISSNKSINNLWDPSYRFLDEQSSILLGVLNFVAPDSVPTDLFESKRGVALPQCFQICTKRFR